ncbi:hypothetical protein B0H14DRAFT_1043617 [Mycena olivaceomarginata]|nr:hypothetical protein B0H14DRAFT_1043617 [Mycena olivaceomarginata]
MRKQDTRLCAVLDRATRSIRDPHFIGLAMPSTSESRSMATYLAGLIQATGPTAIQPSPSRAAEPTDGRGGARVLPGRVCVCVQICMYPIQSAGRQPPLHLTRLPPHSVAGRARCARIQIRGRPTRSQATRYRCRGQFDQLPLGPPALILSSDVHGSVLVYALRRYGSVPSHPSPCPSRSSVTGRRACSACRTVRATPTFALEGGSGGQRCSAPSAAVPPSWPTSESESGWKNSRGRRSRRGEARRTMLGRKWRRRQGGISPCRYRPSRVGGSGWGAVCFVVLVLPQARGKGRACVAPISRLRGKGRDAPSTRTLCSRGPAPGQGHTYPISRTGEAGGKAMRSAARTSASARLRIVSAVHSRLTPPSSSPAAHHQSAPPRTLATENSRFITSPHRSRPHALHSRPVRRYRLRMSCLIPQHHIRIRTHPRRMKRRRPGRTMGGAALGEGDSTESHHRDVVVARGGGGT